MSEWDDLDGLTAAVGKALAEFRWADATRDREALVERVRRSDIPPPLDRAVEWLEGYRRHRRFTDARRLAEALIEAGTSAFAVAHVYAQASIDDGELMAAERALAGLDSAALSEPDRLEMLGLLGRLHKQRFVNAHRGEASRRKRHLEASIGFYRSGYGDAPARGLWHAINVVALLERAARDGLALSAELARIDAKQLAREVLVAAGTDAGDPWHPAIRMEANVALGDWREAVLAAYDYTVAARDAFAIASTLRQMQEVWSLSANDPIHAPLLGMLRQALLRRTGGEVSIGLDEPKVELQANFAKEPFLHMEWFQRAQERCRAVGQVLTPTGDGHGTGFLIDPKDFFTHPDRINGPVLLTNWHVLSDGSRAGSLRPDRARVRFGPSGEPLRVDRVIASAPELDAVFVTLEGVRRPYWCPRKLPPVSFGGTPPERVYVIGYPRNEGLSVSLHDSHWLDNDDTYVHYRTPTTPGSSGSPVFDQRNWEVVALHHGGGANVPRLKDVGGVYEANEGIRIDRIREAVKDSV